MIDVKKKIEVQIFRDDRGGRREIEVGEIDRGGREIE